MPEYTECRDRNYDPNKDKSERSSVGIGETDWTDRIELLYEESKEAADRMFRGEENVKEKKEKQSAK